MADSKWPSVFVELMSFESFTNLHKLTQTFLQVKKLKLHPDDMTKVSLEPPKSFQEGPYSWIVPCSFNFCDKNLDIHPGASWSYKIKTNSKVESAPAQAVRSSMLLSTR